MAQIISVEQANEDLTRWLDSKRISEKKRESNEHSNETIINAICEGNMVVNEDCTIELNLLFVIGKEKKVESLTFKNRLTVGQRQRAVKGIKPDDGDGRLSAYIAALTDSPGGIIGALDSGEDYERASAIAVYFL